MRVPWQAKGTDCYKALLVATELHEGAVPLVHDLLNALHRELHSGHLCVYVCVLMGGARVRVCVCVCVKKEAE